MRKREIRPKIGHCREKKSRLRFSTEPGNNHINEKTKLYDCKDKENGWISQPSHSFNRVFKNRYMYYDANIQNFYYFCHVFYPHRIAHIGIRPPRLDSSGRFFYLIIAILIIAIMIFASERPAAMPAKNISHSIFSHQGSFSSFFISFPPFLR